ncbi:MAG: class I SAM-dependent methyltransferase [Candidatus Delongbacteria bacterium]|nr:class I SAM-dependent methyltransferase [Candidatus Delongbacteria bacterium]
MIKQGIIRKDNYEELKNSDIFKEIENYSDDFLRLSREKLTEFADKWVQDPFHQWSRVYEYPFVISQIVKYANSSSNKLKVLDAGSGISFAPYYLAENLEGIGVECCDYDDMLIEIFGSVNKLKDSNVKFFPADIRNIKQADNTYDIIYCISVLEHTDNYTDIIDEFNRILKPGGILILTFDISIDGSADIPVAKAEQLLNKLETTFKNYNLEGSLDVVKELDNEDLLLTTRYIKETNRSLLPWKYPYLMWLKTLSKGKMPKSFFRNLACYCGVFEKK